MRVYLDREIPKGPLEIRPYAGNPVHPALLRRKASNNGPGGDNPQERL